MIDIQLFALIWPKLAGMVFILDGLYSYMLYVGTPSWRKGMQQTWMRDHWVRALRSLIGLVLVLWA